jgi:hypothetical protein
VFHYGKGYSVNVPSFGTVNLPDPYFWSNIIAVYLTLLHSQNYPLVNYFFYFGSWIRYYYPFVPRSLENVLILGDKKPNSVNLDLNLDTAVMGILGR